MKPSTPLTPIQTGQNELSPDRLLTRREIGRIPWSRSALPSRGHNSNHHGAHSPPKARNQRQAKGKDRTPGSVICKCVTAPSGGRPAGEQANCAKRQRGKGFNVHLIINL
ncbi:Hypothetical predicted protein [Pelobates cultripes]|uniref:Uncharacterized protein n=1 Tax=Pelobates cultripes TaxID=61616 RepID=A0AAD1VU07_PELCU|nr:Hypothetical predicted protein [Pelobates cultripes]